MTVHHPRQERQGQQQQQVSSNSSSSQLIGTILTVPTFRPETTKTISRRCDAPPFPKEQDPFLYFSNQDRRMTYLLRPGKQQQATATAPEHDVDDMTMMVEEERRQRITFEVHPDLMYLEDLPLSSEEDYESIDLDLDLLLRIKVSSLMQ